MELNNKEIGVGATKELNLRVSVASLVRVLIEHPENTKKLVVLERTATVHKMNGKSNVVVKAKPFGGGARIINPEKLEKLIGPFNYDSERSGKEKDFRILIQPESWDKIKQFCEDSPIEKGNEILDASPDRELSEEFKDCINLTINPDQYSLKPLGMIIDDQPVKTESVRAYGFPTVRIYYTFEARIKDQELIRTMLTNSVQYTDDDLRKMALEDAHNGGKGRANAALSLELEVLKNIYASDISGKHNKKINVEDHQLDGNVYAIFID